MGTIVSELLGSKDQLPPKWEDPITGEANRVAREELSWSLVHHLLAHLLFKDPLPAWIRVGREQVMFAIDDTAWQAISREIGLLDAEARREFNEDLTRILRREAPRRPSALLSRRAAAILVLLDGFSRHPRGDRRHSPRHGTLGFDDTAYGPTGEQQSVDELVAWAGAAGQTPEERYQIVFHVVWRPLLRRFEREMPPSAEAEAKPLLLPIDFFQRTQATDTESRDATAPPPATEPAPRARASSPEPGLAEVPTLTVLHVLFEPLLALRADPAILIEQAESSAKGLAADLLRAWRRALLLKELKLYGTPGDTLTLQLPDRAWRVVEGPFRPRHGDKSANMRIVRRGVLLAGEVVIPGVVIYDRTEG